MKWKIKQRQWKHRFAILPTDDGDGNWIWLKWYWLRWEGLYYAISFTKDKPSN